MIGGACLCNDIGIAEGDVVRCRRTSRAVILLETTPGRTVILDSDWARFVAFSVIGGPELRPAAPAAQIEAAP